MEVRYDDLVVGCEVLLLLDYTGVQLLVDVDFGGLEGERRHDDCLYLELVAGGHACLDGSLENEHVGGRHDLRWQSHRLNNDCEIWIGHQYVHQLLLDILGVVAVLDVSEPLLNFHLLLLHQLSGTCKHFCLN